MTGVQTCALPISRTSQKATSKTPSNSQTTASQQVSSNTAVKIRYTTVIVYTIGPFPEDKDPNIPFSWMYWRKFKKQTTTAAKDDAEWWNAWNITNRLSDPVRMLVLSQSWEDNRDYHVQLFCKVESGNN